MKNFNFQSIISIVVISLFIGVIFVYADWTPPPAGAPICPASEPACNAPINTGSANQYKIGALAIEGVLRGYSDAIFDGKVGIGTTGGPGQKLDVVGAIRIQTSATAYNTNGPYTWCTANSCPSGTGGNSACTCQTNRWQTTNTCTYNSFASGGNNFRACVYTATIAPQNVIKIIDCTAGINGGLSCAQVQ